MKRNSTKFFVAAALVFAIWLVCWASLGFVLKDNDLYEILAWPHWLLIVVAWLTSIGGIWQLIEETPMAAVVRPALRILKITEYSTGSDPHGSIVFMRTVRRIAA